MKGTNGALGEIVCSVAGGSCSVRSRFISVGVAVAGVIAVATIPTTVGIFGSCTCWPSSVGIVTNLVDELAVLLQQFINMRLLFVNLCLLFPNDLQYVVVLCGHLLDVFLVGRCRYRHLAEIFL